MNITLKSNKGVNYIEKVEATNTGSAVITTAELKGWARVDDSADDALISNLIDSITDYVERYTNSSIITKDVTAIIEVNNDAVWLPERPVQSVNTVSYWDTENEEWTATTNFYQVGDKVQITEIESGLYKFEYTAGYSTVPPGLEVAIKQAILTAYEDRQDHAESVEEIPMSSRQRLQPYIYYW